MKAIVWCGDSLDRLRDFPDEARQKAGRQLNRLQHGFEPHDWKPMPGVGARVCEVRVRHAGEFRVMYVAKFEEALYVLHAFQKKARKTPKQDLDIAAGRFRILSRMREGSR
jgi:phage-related protein